MGLEQDEQAILACVRRGLDVVQADLNRAWPPSPTGSSITWSSRKPCRR